MTNAYAKWTKRVGDTETPWSESEIIYFRKAVGSSGIQEPKERAALRQAFAERAFDVGYRITEEQSLKGTAYLLAKSLKQNGIKRAGCRLGDRELAILQSLDHHRLVGLHRDRNVESFLPIYRATDVNGQSFDYVGATYEMVEVIK